MECVSSVIRHAPHLVSSPRPNKRGIRVLQGIPLSVPQECDLDVGRVLATIAAQQLSMRPNPFSVERAGDVEKLTFLVSGIVNHPALALLPMLRVSAAGTDLAGIACIGESLSEFLKHQVSAFGQVSDTFLVSVLEPQRFADNSLFSIRHRRTSHGMCRYTLGHSDVSPKNARGLLNVREMRNTSVRLL